MKQFHSHCVIRIGGGCLLALVVAVSGCSGGKSAKGDITGSVSYKGAPVTGGSVTFQPTGGTSGRQGPRGNIDGLGNYRAIDVPVGDYKVIVETESARFMTGMPKGLEMKDMKPPPDKSMPKSDDFEGMADKMPKYVLIPAKYAKAETTPLTYKVVKGTQKHNIELTD